MRRFQKYNRGTRTEAEVKVSGKFFAERFLNAGTSHR